MHDVVTLTKFQLDCEQALDNRLKELGINDVAKTVGALKSNSLPEGAGYFIRLERKKPEVTVWIYDDEGMVAVREHEYVYEAIDYPDDDSRTLLLVESAVRCFIGQLPQDDGTASIILYPPV